MKENKDDILKHIAFLFAVEGYAEKGGLKSQMEITNQYWLNNNNYDRQVKSMAISSFP